MPPLHAFLKDDGWIQLIGLPLHPLLFLQLIADGTGRMRVRQLRLDATGTPEPVHSTDLREIPISRIEAIFTAQRGLLAPGDTFTFALTEDESEFRLPPGSPPDGLTDEFLRDVARAYAAALQRGERPNVALAAQTEVPLKTAQSWVYTARQRGIMPRGSRGRPG